MTNPRGTLTLFNRETKRFMKVYLQTVFAPVFSNVLYFTIFGIAFSKMEVAPGLGYLQFLVPGLIAMGIINNAFQNPASSLIQMKYQGLIHNLLTIPLSRAEILLAFVSSAVLRGFIVGAATLITSMFFVDVPFHSIPLIIISALLISLFFAFLGVLVGVWANEFDQNAFIQNFVLTPLVFLGGVFYAIDRLPEWAQVVSHFNPMVYMIDLLRYSFTSVGSYSLSTNLTVVGVSVAVLGAVTYLVLKSGWRIQN